jgi:hypothetical protein
MSWPLYVDHHVPWAVTSGLRRQGCDVLTASEDQAAERDDDVLLDRATLAGRILVTQDRDFISLAAMRRQQGRPFFGIVYCPQQRLTIGEMIEWLELVASLLREDEVRDQLIYLPLT